jgi:hypothetical protein
MCNDLIITKAGNAVGYLYLYILGLMIDWVQITSSRIFQYVAWLLYMISLLVSGSQLQSSYLT